MKRIKTTVMIPMPMLKQVDELGRMIGVGRNALVCIALAGIVARLHKVISPLHRRRHVVSETRKILQDALEQLDQIK